MDFFIILSAACQAWRPHRLLVSLHVLSLSEMHQRKTMSYLDAKRAGISKTPGLLIVTKNKWVEITWIVCVNSALARGQALPTDRGGLSRIKRVQMLGERGHLFEPMPECAGMPQLWRTNEHLGHHRPFRQNQYLSFYSTRICTLSLQNPGWSWTARCCFSTRALCSVSLSVTTDCCLKLINKVSQMDPRAHALSVSSALLCADIWVMPVFYHKSWDLGSWNHQTVI